MGLSTLRYTVHFSTESREGRMPQVNLRDDLKDIIGTYFSEKSVRCRAEDKADDLATRYCEMRIRHIDPLPRTVHFASQLHDTLGRLADESNPQERVKALDAWRTVFRLRHLFTSGGDLTPYLSRGIKDATSRDGLLWDYGMHHFHLSSRVEKSGLIRRSDYLLFAIVTDDRTFFVDVRKHRDPQDLQWVRQDLLEIVHTNWAEITGALVLRGVGGSTLTDEQKKELRRKNVNSVHGFGEYATMPLGGGTTGDGGSVWCRMWADRLLREIERHEAILSNQPEEVRAALQSKGLATNGVMDLRLVPLDSIDATPELAEHLLEGDHASRRLHAMGFAIVDAGSGCPVVIDQVTSSPDAP